MLVCRVVLGFCCVGCVVVACLCCVLCFVCVMFVLLCYVVVMCYVCCLVWFMLICILNLFTLPVSYRVHAVALHIALALYMQCHVSAGFSFPL